MVTLLAPLTKVSRILRMLSRTATHQLKGMTMSQNLLFERCPETGICSIFHGDAKIDLMPDEVMDIADANGDADKIRAVIAESDNDFAGALTPEELGIIGQTLS